MNELTDDELLDMIDEFCDESVREDSELIMKALDAAAKKAIGEALEILSKFKTDFPDEVKVALDTLTKLAALKEPEKEEEEGEEEEEGKRTKKSGLSPWDFTMIEHSISEIEKADNIEELELMRDFLQVMRNVLVGAEILKSFSEEHGTSKRLIGQEGNNGDEEIMKGGSFPWSFSLSGGRDEED